MISIFKNLFKQKQTTIEVELICPDGLSEYAGFEIPSETKRFINYVNGYTNGKGYSIKLSDIPLAIQMGLI